WLVCTELPQSSVAVHVRRVTDTAGHTAGSDASRKLTASVASQASENVGVPKLGVAGHSIVWSAGVNVTVGATLSTTVIVWLHVAVLPQLSVPVQVRLT